MLKLWEVRGFSRKGNRTAIRVRAENHEAARQIARNRWMTVMDCILVEDDTKK